MKNRILVVTDKLDCRWADKAISEINENHYDLLTLGVEGKCAAYLHKQKIARLESFEIIDCKEFSESAQDEIRKFVPDLICEFPRKEYLPGKSLLSLFRFEAINLWWFNKMSEKGAWSTPLIKRIYHLELIRRVYSANIYQEVWFELKDGQMLELMMRNRDKFGVVRILNKSSAKGFFWVKLAKNLFWFQFTVFLRWLMVKTLRISARIKLPESVIAFFTFYPYFWSKPFDDDGSELFFRSLPDRLPEKHSCYLAWLTMGLRDLWRKRGAIRRKFSSKNIILAESFLTLLDFYGGFVISIAFVFRMIIYRLSFKARIKEDFNGFDITNIVINEFEQSFAGIDTAMCLLIMTATRKFAACNKIKALIFRAEFQPYERALVYGIRGRAKTVGFQHQAIARNHLQYFFSQNEVKDSYENRENPDVLPLPDHFIVTGEYAYGIFRKNGFPEERLHISGPLRYAGMIDFLKSNTTKREARNRYGIAENKRVFLIASPVTSEDVSNLFINFAGAINRFPCEVELLIKSHPVVKFDLDIKCFMKSLAADVPYKILPDGVNLNDYLTISDALILMGTTLGVEAICLGVMPILLGNTSTFGLNPLLEIEDACLKANNSDDLANAMLSVLANDDRVKEARLCWPEAIRKTFYRLNEDPIENFIKNIEKIGDAAP